MCEFEAEILRRNWSLIAFVARLCFAVILSFCRIYRWNIALLTTTTTARTSRTSFVIVGSAQMLFPSFFLSFFLFFYDYDEPIGMCSHLIIHNLTRVSSVPQAACRWTFSLPIFICFVDDMLPEIKIPIKTLLATQPKKQFRWLKVSSIICHITCAIKMRALIILWCKKRKLALEASSYSFHILSTPSRVA